jgi:hypothetical protein
MMRRAFLLPLAIVAAAFAAACTVDSSVGPRSGGSAFANSRPSSQIPGSNLTSKVLSGQLTPINCSPKDSSYGSALIGASGGDLIIGPHRLIVPPGALTQPTLISGTVPAGKPFQIDLQPHGLTFKKAAGLVLDASSCVAVPDIVYLIDGITPSDPIEATYSNWWHTIAAPIWHFSGYAVAF